MLIISHIEIKQDYIFTQVVAQPSYTCSDRDVFTYSGACARIDNTVSGKKWRVMEGESVSDGLLSSCGGGTGPGLVP